MTENKIIVPSVEDVKTDLDINMDGWFVKQEQEIPDWYLKELEDARTESKNAPAADFHRIASVPVVLAEQWKREGFDIYREQPEAIVKRLQQLGYSKLMATSKRIY